MTPVRSKTYTALQKAYDQCYLTCNTASYYESQGNESEALRCWRECLNQIQYYNASNRTSGAFRSVRAKSETEKTLEQSLRAMELQCQERVDLLETLRISRTETHGGATSGSPRRETATRLTKQPIQPPAGSVPYGGQNHASYNVPPPLPQRPSQQPCPEHPLPFISSGNSASQPLLTPTPPLQHVVYPKLGRTPSPEKRTTFLTTLRTKKPQRASHHSTLEGPGTAAKAAGLAWGSVVRQDVPSFTRTSSGSSVDQLPRETEHPSSSRQAHSTSDLVNAPVPMPDPVLYCPPPRPNGPNGPRPRPQSTIIQPPVRAMTFQPQPSQPQLTVSKVSPTTASPPIQPVSRRETAHEPMVRQSVEREHRISQVPAPVSQGKAKRLSAENPIVPLLDSRHNRDSIHGNSIQRKPVPSTIPSESNEAQSPSSGRETGDELNSPDYVGQEEETKEEEEGEDESKLWKARVEKALAELDKGVDEFAASQIINEIVVKGDEVHWDDVAGLEVAKMALKEAVVYPFLRPDLFRGLREPARGMLLFGPPGTGKTMIARAVATESNSTFFSISASSLTSKYLGESEKLVRALFALAKALAPSIIFVDEIDSLLSSRGSGEHEATRRLKTEFLIQWSSLQNAAAGKEVATGDPSRVLVLGATNLPWAIDEAARRRFVRRQYIPLPESSTRALQLAKLLSHQNHALSPSDIEKLVDLTDGFSGSDITALAKDAAMGPLRSLGEALLSTSMDEIRPISLEDFERSLQSIRPSVSKSGLEEFENWAKDFGERV